MDMLNTAVDTLSCLYLTCGCTPTLGTESINIFVVEGIKLNCEQSIKDHKRKTRSDGFNQLCICQNFDTVRFYILL